MTVLEVRNRAIAVPVCSLKRLPQFLHRYRWTGDPSWSLSKPRLVTCLLWQSGQSIGLITIHHKHYTKALFTDQRPVFRIK